MPIATKMGNGISWTKAERKFLRDCWGEKSPLYIAQKLNRSVSAVKQAAYRLRLGSFLKRSEYLTAYQIAKLLGVDPHTVIDSWIGKHGLKYIPGAKLGYQRGFFVTYETLINWLRENTSRWSSNKVEYYALGMEPDWLKRKREQDRLRPLSLHKKWTASDIAKMQRLYQSNKSLSVIASRLQRTKSAIQNKLK